MASLGLGDVKIFVQWLLSQLSQTHEGVCDLLRVVQPHNACGCHVALPGAQGIRVNLRDVPGSGYEHPS
jgi:hypothetical protein